MKKTFWLKVILACGNAIILTDLGGLVPAMDSIAKAFPMANPNLVHEVLVIPLPVMILFMLIAGRMCRVVAKKTVYLLGIALYAVGGLGAMFYDNIFYLLETRALTGVGAGFVQPTYTSLIADHYEGNERSHALGFSMGFGSSVGILFSFATGQLARIN
jgi:MFS family permease